MPVKGLLPSLLEVGKIKIGKKGEKKTSSGGKEFRMPIKLDHFLITKNEKDPKTEDYIVDDALVTSLKKDGGTKVDGNGNIIQLPIRLLYDDIDLNFPTFYARYSGSKRACHGDGEKATTRDGREITCPCEKIKPDYDGVDKCKINGTLSCIIAGSDTIGGCHKFRTTSMNTAKSILGSLTVVKAATGGRLAFLPLSLIIQPKTTTIPGDGGTTTVYIVSVVYSGTIERLQQQAMEMAKSEATYRINMDNIENEARLLLETTKESEEEESEIQEEFYPDTIDGDQPVREAKETPVEKSKEDIPKEKSEKPASEAVVDVKPETKEADPPVKTPKSLPDPKNINPNDLPAENMEQLKILSGLKREHNIDNDKWREMLQKYGVVSAKQMTIHQLKKFVKEIDDIPF